MLNHQMSKSFRLNERTLSHGYSDGIKISFLSLLIYKKKYFFFGTCKLKWTRYNFDLAKVLDYLFIFIFCSKKSLLSVIFFGSDAKVRPKCSIYQQKERKILYFEQTAVAKS